jgi:SAM-dependent methyltransferase
MKNGDEQPMRRRESFDSVANFYDLYRTLPPREVVDAVVELSNLRNGSRVLEIGCGTGQLSVPLAQEGVALVAVELGPHLAARARQNLAPFPNARVEVSSFEDWQLPKEKFDAVICAGAFHWLDPGVRFSKSATALRPAGFLTILHVHHVKGGTPGFFEETQPYYMKWGLSDNPSFQPPEPAQVPDQYPELERLPEFSSVKRLRFEIPRIHSTAAYIGWLNTDSLILGLNEQARRGFLQDIERLIDSDYHGVVARNYVYEVIAAERAPH